MMMLWILSALIIALAIWRPTYALWLMVGAAIIQDDRLITQTVNMYGAASIPTIFNARVGWFQFIDWYVIIVLTAALVRLAIRGHARPALFDAMATSSTIRLLGVATVPYVISSVVGIALHNEFLPLFQDLQNHLYLLSLAVAIAGLCETLDDFARLLVFIMAALSVKVMILLLRFLFRVGFAWGAVFRVTLSTDTILLLVLIAAGMYYLLAGSATRWQRYGIAATLSIAYFILFEVAGRTVMVLFVAQMILLYSFLGPGRHRPFWWVLAIWNLTLLGYMWLFDPELARFYVWRIGSLFGWSASQLDGKGYMLSNAVKTQEIKNIIALLRQKHALLFGLGQGAWWTDQFFPITLPYLNDGYPAGEVRHFSTHLQVLSQLLKMGLFGVTVYWVAMLALVVRSIRNALNSSGRAAVLLRPIALALLALLLNMANFERLYLFTGIFIGGLVLVDVARSGSGEHGSA